MPMSWDQRRAIETEAAKAAAKAEAEAAEQAAANPPEPEETKPDGYFLNCTPEEFQAELRRRGIHNHGHGLPS